MATENLEYLDESGMNRTAVNVLAKIAEAKAQIEAELDSLDYAQPDGIYPDMTVGAVIGADETAQWSQRESTGTGSATVRSVQGAAVVWNQLNNNSGNTDTKNGVTVTKNSDGSWTANGVSTSESATLFGIFSLARKSGHKYLVRGCAAGGSANTYYLGFSGNVTDTGNGGIYTAGADTAAYLYLIIGAGATIDNLTFWPQVFDLTQMFGSGNEPQTVAEFEQMYPAAYYPYSAPTLKPVQIAGIQSTDANGDALDSVEWETQTLRAAGSVRDELTADELVTRVGVVDLGTLAWTAYGGGFYSYAIADALAGSAANRYDNIRCAPYTSQNVASISGLSDKCCSMDSGRHVQVKDSAYSTADELRAALSGVMCFYAIATPTTTPIIPALPMTYKVQQGGAESIIVPDGEISAAPIITIADPVNMSTELARIWAAIEALQANRQTLQSSVRNDTQEITSDLTPIDVTKEVQQTDENREVSE